MKCYKCAAEIEAGSKFCTDCGARQEQEIACRHCDELIPVQSAFCTNCGQPNQAAPIPAEFNAAKDQTRQQLPQSDDFLFLLSEDLVTRLTDKNEAPICGYQGALLKDGKLLEVLKQSNENNQGPESFLGGLWKRARELLNREAPSGALGSLDGRVQCFVVMDLGNLPIVSYSHPSPVLGYPNAALKFDFWVEAEDLGLFIQRCAEGRTALTLLEFKSIATEKLQKLLQQHSADDLFSNWRGHPICDALKTAYGISTQYSPVAGQTVRRIICDVIKYQGDVSCPSCGYQLPTQMKFCEECGNPLSPSVWVNGTKYLLTADGEQVTLKVSFLLDESGGLYLDDSKVSLDVIQVIGPIIRNQKTADLMVVDVLPSLSRELSEILKTTWKGYVTDVLVMDLRTASEEWFFNSEALLKEELRRVEAQRNLLKVDDAQLDVEEAAFALTMRSLKQRDFEALEKRRTKLESRKQEAQLEIEEHSLEMGIDLQKENLEAQHTQTRVERDRNFQRSNVAEDRKDELDQVAHDTTLEKKLAQHDIDLANMAAIVQSQQARSSVDDATYAKDADLFQRVKEAEMLGGVQENLQDRQHSREIDKLRAMAEIEASMSQQDQLFEMNKIESMKALDAQQILALQAAQLAKTAGGGEATAALIKSIAESQASAASASLKDDLYSKMIEMQKKSSDDLIKAHQEAAKIAQSTSEKSMEMLGKVASAPMTKKERSSSAKGLDADADEKTETTPCVNVDCETVFKGKIPKVCGQCGTPQS
jgi:hypothetical protein